LQAERIAAAGPLDLATILGYFRVVTRVGIGELRDRVSRYVRRAEKGETIVIVNRDREVAVLQPWRGTKRRGGRLLGAMKGSARVVGDIEAPIHDLQDWFRT
jgi:prevent-host-death family protein